MKVAVIAGGLSLERQVSLHSGQRVVSALKTRGHDVVLLDVDQQLVRRLEERPFDVAYLALHGRAGEDGTIQGLLDLIGLPYTGPDARASALAWDKAIIKGRWSVAGIATPPWVAISTDAIRDMGAARLLPKLVERIGLPLVVKPSQGGAAMGVGFVDAPDRLREALVDVFRYHPVALVERFVEGTEVAVSLLDGQPLPIVEITPDGDHYDFSARYTPGATAFHIPARLDDDVTRRVQEEAARAYELAGCRHVTRADMIVDRSGQPWFLELDTCPGLTETSLLPLAAEAAGMDFGELVDRIIHLAVTA